MQPWVCTQQTLSASMQVSISLGSKKVFAAALPKSSPQA